MSKTPAGRRDWLTLAAIWCIPFSLVLTGMGMLWLTRFRFAEGGFYERLMTHSVDWIGSHAILLACTGMLLPAAVAVYRATCGNKGAWLATAGCWIIGVSAILLAGQYSIDFVMPIIARVGGDAHLVHQQLGQWPVTRVLFYELPELVVPGILLTHIALVRAGIIRPVGVLAGGTLWLIVIAGNVLDYVLLARIAITLLGCALIPVAMRLSR